MIAAALIIAVVTGIVFDRCLKKKAVSNKLDVKAIMGKAIVRQN